MFVDTDEGRICTIKGAFLAIYHQYHNRVESSPCLIKKVLR